MKQTMFSFSQQINDMKNKDQSVALKEKNPNKAIQTKLVLDFGKNSATMYDGTAVTSLTHKQVLDLPFGLKPGTLIVCEDSHLGVARTEKSLSQPYTLEELCKFYEDCRSNGVNLRLFPQKSTPRAAEFSNLKKDDENDPISIYQLLEKFPEISLRNPNNKDSKFQALVQEGHLYKQRMNKVLNFARRFEYMHEEDSLSQWIQKNIEKIAANLSPDAQNVFGLDDSFRYKSTDKIGQLNMNNVRMPQIYSVLSSLAGDIVEENERYYIRPTLALRDSTEELPGWYFVKRFVLNMSPFHFRGGVARSNLYYHGAKNWIIAQAKKDGIILKKKTRGKFNEEEDCCFRKYRARYSNSIKELFIVLKGMLEENMSF